MKTKRFLAAVLAIAMLASFISVPVFAEEAVPTLLSSPEGEGYICEDLGILVGPDEDGVTEEYLDTLAMRTQAAMVNLRLFGLEEVALAFDGEETFADTADATAYWQPILEYLKANPGIGWVGDEGGNFLPNEYITGQAFTKILLVALGYEYGLDFDWETTMDFAGEVGLTALADKADADLTVRDMAIAIIEALGFKTNSTTDVTLLTQLVLDGVIDEATAIAAGFEVEEPTLAIVNAYPSATDEVTIVLNMDVPEGTPITLKKDTAGYVVVETIDGATVTLTALFNLPAGTYTVMVGTETAEFEVVTQHAVDLVIEADSVYLMAGQALGVSMLDQYGDNMSLSGTNYSVFNQSSGFVFTTVATKDLTIDVTEEPAEADEIIYVFVYDPVSMLTVSAELPVIAAPYLETLAIGGVTLGDDAATMLITGTTSNVLDITAYDQYGQVMTLVSSMFTTTVPYDYTAEVQILSSNGDVLNAGAISIIDGEFLFNAGNAGTAMFTFIIPDQANIYTSEMITVYANPVLSSIEIAGPVEAVYAYEETTFPAVGFDQYGNTIDVVSTPGTDIDFTWTFDINVDWIDISSANTVAFKADLHGTTTVYYFLNGILQGTFDVTVNEEAYPFQVVALNDVPTAFQTESYKVFSGTYIDVIDQYGRPVDMDAYFDYELDLWSDDNNNLRYDHLDLNTFVIYADQLDETGSDTFYLGIYDLVLDDIAPESIFTFDAAHVGYDDIVSFDLHVVDDVLYGGELDWDLYGQLFIYNNYMSEGSLYPYDNPFLLKAYQEDGTEISLALNDSNIPEIVDVITFSSESAPSFDYRTRKDYPEAPTIYGAMSAAGISVMKVWINGEMVASDEFTVSLDDFAVTSIEATDTVLSWDTVEDMNNEKGFWPPELYPGPEEWGMDMEAILGDSEGISWYARYLAMNLFTIMDQYDVELFWLPLIEAEMIQLIISTEDSGDDTYFYFTIMTPDGVVYDTITVLDDFVPNPLIIGPPPIPEP